MHILKSILHVDLTDTTHCDVCGHRPGVLRIIVARDRRIFCCDRHLPPAYDELSDRLRGDADEYVRRVLEDQEGTPIVRDWRPPVRTPIEERLASGEARALQWILAPRYSRLATRLRPFATYLRGKAARAWCAIRRGTVAWLRLPGSMKPQPAAAPPERRTMPMREER